MEPSHRDRHSGGGTHVRNAIIGFADGLTVPFALTAGLSSLGSPRLVITAGLAELFAGPLSMGLGSILAALTESKHYQVEELRWKREVRETPAAEMEEIFKIFEEYGVSRSSHGVVAALMANEEMWVLFMMDFELKLQKSAINAVWLEGLVMGISYSVGGVLPMIPHFAFEEVNHALFTSIGITAAVLMVFEYFKALVTGTSQKDALWSAAQTLLIGAVAASVSYGIVRAVNASAILRPA